MTAMPDPSTASKEGMPPVYTCTHVVLMAQCLWHGLDSMAIIVSTCFVRNVVSLQLELRINCCLLWLQLLIGFWAPHLQLASEV